MPNDNNNKRVSVKDVAKLSGTSLGTVSRVLNGSTSVSTLTRTRVKDAIHTLGYEPNANARQMRTGRSGLIGVLLPSLSVPFFGILAQSIEQSLFKHGYHSLVCNTQENEKNEYRYVSTLIGQQVDGVVAVAVQETNNFDRLSDNHIPVIAVDRSPSSIASDVVSVDHREGGRLMAEHLLQIGHQHIAIIGAPTHSQPITLRIEGIQAALQEHALKPLEIALTEKHCFDACFGVAKKLLTRCQPTALIGTTDIAAISAIHAAHDHQLKVPEDLSVIGFDNLPYSAHVYPPLTTVEQPTSLLGEIAAMQLLNRIDPERYNAPDMSVLNMHLIKRASTASPQSR